MRLRLFIIGLSFLIATSSLSAAIAPAHLVGKSNEDQWILIEKRNEITYPHSPSVRLYFQKKGKGFDASKPIEYSGHLQSYFYDQKKLYLVYSKNVFLVTNPEENAVVIYSAAREQHIWAMLKFGDELRFLQQDYEGNFGLYKMDGTGTALNPLKDLKADLLQPFCDEGHIVLLGRSNNDPNTNFISIEMRENTPHIWKHTFENETFSNICKIKDEIWFLPKDGTDIRTWKKGDRNFGRLSMPIERNPNFHWISTSETPKGTAWLGYDTLNYHLKLPNQNEEIEIPAYPFEKFKPEFLQGNYQQILINVILIFTLTLMHKQRRKRELELYKEKKIKIQIVPAHLLSRGLAFIFDFFILLPIINLAAAAILGVGYFTKSFPYPQYIFIHSDYTNSLIIQLVIYTILLLGTWTSYHILMDIFAKGSLGKLFFRIQVYNEYGERPTKKQLIIKGLVRLSDLFFFGMIVAIFSPKQKNISDHAAKTMVGRESIY